jgi:thiol-disulfide isomerase/thioredoxin
MNKRILVAIVVLAVVIGGAIGVFALATPTNTAAPQPTLTQQAEAPAPTESEATEETEEAEVVTAGIYVDYSDTAIADAVGTRLLFFHAPWCPQCRSVEEDILASGVPDGVTIIKVDYDSNQALRQQYGVTLQTTFVEVDASGAAVETFVAYETPTLQAVIDAML